MKLISDLPAEKKPGRIQWFFLLRSFLLRHSHDKMMGRFVFTYLLIIIYYYVLKYRIDLSDCIFSSLKHYCKKNWMLLWNVLSLIVTVSSHEWAQSRFSLKHNDPTSFLVPDRIVSLNAFGVWDEETGAHPVYLWNRSLAFQTTLWNCLPLFPEYIKSFCACIITSPVMQPG